MVYISKVYTKFGDAGQTMLANGETVSKSNARVDAYGDVDELNATVGLMRSALVSETSSAPANKDSAPAGFSRGLDELLGQVQQELFNLGAELSTAAPEGEPPKLRVDVRHVEALEEQIDLYNEPLAPLQSFILPGGGPAAAAAHLCRTVCRRAERRVVSLMEQTHVRPEAQRYLNRLSDLFFVLARACASSYGHDEVLWDPART